MMDLIWPTALQVGTDLILLYSMSIRIVQASYCQPEGGSFFIGMFTACSVMLQMLKSKSAYFYIIVKIMLRTQRRLDCSVKKDPH
jgi:hypothetical protein